MTTDVGVRISDENSHLARTPHQIGIRMGRLFLGERIIDGDQPCFIVAEIGQNHQGDVNTAKTLIDIAKDSGADCVKFQKSCLNEKFTSRALERPYSSLHSWGNTYGEHKTHLEFSNEEFRELQRHARDRKILFAASAMDPVSLEFLVSLEVPFIKIGSGDSDNLMLIEIAAKKHVPLVISTGMQDLEGVTRVCKVVESHHHHFALLHCVSAYPTPPSEANLRAIATMQKEFPGTLIGYSGHEEGYNLTLAAVALGAKIIERHITLDKTMKGNDHRCSLEPGEFKELVQSIKEIEQGLGNGIKALMRCEIPCKEKLGKTIVASRKLTASAILRKGDLKIKVADKQGLPPHKWSEIVGQKITRDLNEDDILFWEDLEQV